LVAVILLYPVRPIDISATVEPIGVKFCMMVHTSIPNQSSHLLGAVPNSKFWPKFSPCNREYLENGSRSVTCQIARRDLSKNVRHGAVCE